MKNSNWDENNNWIGDDIPDSTIDWSVKNEDTASVGDFFSVFITIFIAGIMLSLKVGSFVLLVWFTLWVIGVI